jgi:hypothetical protein
MEPPSEAAEATPTAITMFPDTSAELPVSRDNAPLGPAVEVPVWTVTAPDTPADPASALLTSTCPELEAVLAPDVIDTDPPVFVAARPADRVM